MGALTQVGPILADLVVKSAAALAAEDRPVDSVVTVAPGVAPAWDNSCSQIYSRFVSLAPVTGDQRGVQAPCGVLFWIVTVAIAVTRWYCGTFQPSDANGGNQGAGRVITTFTLP